MRDHRDVHRHGSLEIDSDRHFLRRYWQWQRIGWVLAALVLVAALAGLFGGGPLSRMRHAAPDGTVALQWERFLRVEAPARLELTLRTGPGAAVLWLDQDFVRAVRIERITPDPALSEAASDRLLLHYTTIEPGQPWQVAIDFKAQSAGKLAGRTGLVGGSALSFTSFVYP